MNNKKELTILFWMTAIFAVIFFMPLGNERFMTAIDATLDLAQWYAQEHVVLCLLPAFFIAGRERYSNTSGQTPRNGYPTR